MMIYLQKIVSFEFATLVIARGYQNQPFKVLAQSLLLALSENIWETPKIYCFIIHFRIKTAMNWHIYYPFSDTQIRDSRLNMLKYG